jgi:hypothetical protein
VNVIEDDPAVFPCCPHCDHDPGTVHGEPCEQPGCPGAVPAGGEVR